MIATSGDLPTVWYNYALASAGTITGAYNNDFATESLCPKGWTMPSKENTITIAPATTTGSTEFVPIFNPVFGGTYTNGSLGSADSVAHWWSSTAYPSNYRRYVLSYNPTPPRLRTVGDGHRRVGRYIRCVQSS